MKEPLLLLNKKFIKQGRGSKQLNENFGTLSFQGIFKYTLLDKGQQAAL
jgi:hypothetical protein